MATHHHGIIGHQGPTMRNYLLATRPVFLVASLLPVILGTVIGYEVAAEQGGSFDLLAFILAFFTVMLVNLGINVLNDVYDDMNGTDRINKHAVIPFTGGSRVIQNNILSREQMLYWSYLLLTGSIIVGLFLVFYKGYIVLLFGLLGLFLGVGYSMPPVKLASRGLGESAIMLGVGMLPVIGAAWLQTGYFSWSAFLLSIPVGLWVTNIILVNEVPDADADERSGKRTLAVRFGDKGTAGLYLMANLLAAVIVCIAAIFGIIPLVAVLLPILLLLPAILTTKKIRLWNQNKQGFITGIKFNIATYVINILWIVICILVT